MLICCVFELSAPEGERAMPRDGEDGVGVCSDNSTSIYIPEFYTRTHITQHTYARRTGRSVSARCDSKNVNKEVIAS